VKGLDNKTFFTGANDGKIIKWDASLKPQEVCNVNSMVSLSAGLRSLDVAKDGTLLVGTRGADVIEVSSQG